MPVKRPPIKTVGSNNPFINMALIAESGFGKTVVLGSGGKDTLILSMDPEGTDSSMYMGGVNAQAQEIVVRDFQTLNDVIIWLKQEGHKEFKYLGIDSAPEAQKIMQGDWLDKNRANAGKRHPDVLGIDGHQVTQLQFIKFVKQMNDLPLHTIYTAKPQEYYDSEGEVYYLPNLHGQKGDVARDFMGYMKIQGFGVYVDKKVRRGEQTIDIKARRWYFTPMTGYKGKDRTNSLGEYLDDITLPDIVRRVEEKAAAAARPAASKATSPARVRRTTKSA
jgi:hypothetical protein